MRIRVLGAHNLETMDARHTCFLVDDRLAIDAGSLMTSLSPSERDGLKIILLTHRHYDHLRDLPSLGLSTVDNGVTVDVYGLPETLEALSTRLMDGLLYPNFSIHPSPENPKYRLTAVTFGQPFSAAGLEISPIAVPHSVPAVGYILRSPQGGAAAFTGDTGGGLVPFLRDPSKPSLLFVEVTYLNQEEEKARRVGHLVPLMLQQELAAALDQSLPIPQVVVVHMDLRFEDIIRRELADVSASLGVEITPATEGMEFQV